MLDPWYKRCLRALLQSEPFRLYRETVPIAHLPKAFHGFTIAQISDLHLDEWNTPVMEVAIDAVNALQADLIVCTGDTIAQGRQFLPEVTHLLKQLQARMGKLACLGNHDYSDGYASYGVRQALKKAGFEVLVNESTELTLACSRIQLAGADDLILGKQCLRQTSRRLCPEVPTVLLSHNPENFEAMAHFTPSLVLSGHTHGGQVYLPGGLHRYVFKMPYIAGSYQCNASRLYVNRGLGSAIIIEHWKGRRLAIPTPRFAVEPEITLFTLVNPSLEIAGSRLGAYRLAG